MNSILDQFALWGIALSIIIIIIILFVLWALFWDFLENYLNVKNDVLGTLSFSTMTLIAGLLIMVGLEITTATMISIEWVLSDPLHNIGAIVIAFGLVGVLYSMYRINKIMKIPMEE